MRKHGLYAVAIAALLVTAGCTGLSTGGDGTDASQLQDDAASAMADADTYRMEMRMNVSAGGQELTVPSTRPSTTRPSRPA